MTNVIDNPQAGVQNCFNEHDGERRADGGVYTEQDSSQFGRLNDALQQSMGSVRLGAEPVATEPVTSAFDYSESDVRAFEDLLANLADSRSGRQGQTASQRVAGQGFGYTAGDNERFSSLMAADQFPSTTTKPVTVPQSANAVVESAFKFTDRDNEQFAKIVSGTPISPEQDASGTTDRLLQRDRDVGPMRIVEFDKEYARKRQNKWRGNPEIKVRYFD